MEHYLDEIFVKENSLTYMLEDKCSLCQRKVSSVSLEICSECEEAICQSCFYNCIVCETIVCQSCVYTCKCCGEPVCPDCVIIETENIQDAICEECHESLKQGDVSDEDAE